MKRSCCTVLIAWVMWIHNQGPNTDSWTQTMGFVSQKQCTENMNEKLETWSQFKDAKLNGASVTFSENKMTVSYQCLPDNEDPRKAKRQPPAKGN